jgi:hypothetical protein
MACINSDAGQKGIATAGDFQLHHVLVLPHFPKTQTWLHDYPSPKDLAVEIDT